jgi:hypothetical protein
MLAIAERERMVQPFPLERGEDGQRRAEEFPCTLVISRDGRVAVRVIGIVTYAGLERLIRKAARFPAGRNKNAGLAARLPGW